MIASALAAVFAARGARAGEGERYYGWQNVLADVGSLTLAAGSASMNTGTGAPRTIGTFVGLSGLLLGSPLVHAAHGQWGNAGKSLGLRVALPLAGLLIGGGLGYALDHKSDCAEGCGAVFLGGGGFLAGGLAAVIIDDGFLAWEPKPGLRIAPAITMGKEHRAIAGLAMRF